MLMSSPIVHTSSLAAGRDQCESFRKMFPVFTYESYSYRQNGLDIDIEFCFSIGKAFIFRPRLILKNTGNQSSRINSGQFENLVFHLGLAEIPSYWKATCSPIIDIRCGQLDQFQKSWWKSLILKGMGEFFFTNRLSDVDEKFVEFTSNDVMPRQVAGIDEQLSPRSIVPIGGGRDSAFTLYSLSKGDRPFNTMMLNPTPAAIRVSRVVHNAPPIIVKRHLDPLLMKLNQDGYLNGHTPFSSYLAFLNALCLSVYDYSDIVIANERSANEANITYGDREINHQYSKSFEFEEKFDSYLSCYLLRSGRYFSFIRSMYELQIGRAFSNLPEMFSAFRSCNRFQRRDAWCGHCAKCVSVYITSYPFMDSDALAQIFGGNLYDQPSTIDIVRALEGKSTYRPLDCICTIREAQASVYLAVRRLRNSGEPLPLALTALQDDIAHDEGRLEALATELLNARGPDRLPEYYSNLLNAEWK